MIIMSRYAILSDIHGNLFALKEVIKDLNNQKIDQIILLGDLIDYGMQPNEVVEFINNELSSKIISLRTICLANISSMPL